MSFITKEQAKKSEQYDNWLKENSEFLEKFLESFLITKKLKSELNFEDKVITKIIEKESKKSELQNRFVQYIGNFFDAIEEKHKLEKRTLEAQLEIKSTNLRTLMTIIHQQYEDGNIEEDKYKMACLVYSMGHSETFNIEK
jgi:hypothetical protein